MTSLSKDASHERSRDVWCNPGECNFAVLPQYLHHALKSYITTDYVEVVVHELKWHVRSRLETAKEMQCVIDAGCSARAGMLTPSCALRITRQSAAPQHSKVIV
jgi:hypothetical protein